MGRLFTFLLGVVLGAGLYHGALQYHLVHARDGLHLIPKTPPRLSEVYVDVRAFDAQDWLGHPQLVLAIRQAGQEQILGEAVENIVADKLGDWLGTKPAPPNGP